MFTGIITAIGKVVKYDGSHLGIRTPFRHVRLGESISVEGVCLTVAKKAGAVVSFDVGPETRRITTLGTLKPGAQANLERALRVGDRVGGHWVTGHVEETGRIQKIVPAGRNRWIELKVPSAVRRFIVAKGSLTVDGISLTVVRARKNLIMLMIIPHTLSQTTLGRKKVGERVNLEADLLAKYVIR